MHLSYGLLIVVPLRELCVRIIGLQGFWAYFIPLDLTMSSSLAYELIEWGAAVVFGGDLGMTQTPRRRTGLGILHYVL